MDEPVIKYYRRLLKSGFKHAGLLEDPSVFLDTVNESVPICGHMGDYLHLFIRIRDHRISAMTYLCSCEPTTNVAVEILCGMLPGMPLDEVMLVKEDALLTALGADSEELRKKAGSLLQLVHIGLQRFLSQTGQA